ncbi:chromosome segregation protein SMC [Thioclava sp. SK-1]|uniref:chromosome segregation protein SMC n=1 Tax=Thioclava sp. SK-1 TaxID=1889770 RepID=UPI000826C8C2|nr:chromosome segregation protein SMC [Thioclava sp. SK-1]OCX61628.1 chromosome segregation protein SMC [Thioclava sp. SK-1]
MRFSRLRLNGFKSFVDPTDLVIHDGLTGVVGPNGCGKSNLLEALRWVMGENRPSAMRGGGMEDVIFAGAASRGARNFAEVVLQLDNGERLAPSGFNDADLLEITRRITRDAGSAYKVNTRDVRARDVQMLFADASTGAHSPALVRQGQISELINAKPKARRRILEEAAGISGLYHRRHEAELKLKGAEANLLRVNDVIEQLATQLATLSRQARQAARYRAIAEDLRMAEGMLLYRRWREADETRDTAEQALTTAHKNAAQAEQDAAQAETARAALEDRLPPLRDEDSIANAILQRLTVRHEQLAAQDTEAQARIAALKSQIAQLDRDIDREAELNRDADDTIARLTAEHHEIRLASDGHDAQLLAAADAAQGAAEVLLERETVLSDMTEEVARLAARHQSAQRLVTDQQLNLQKSLAAAQGARQTAETAQEALDSAATQQDLAACALDEAAEAAETAEETLTGAEETRSAVQDQESTARTARAVAEGEATALTAELTALTRLVERESADEAQILDAVQVEPGYEAALGAALTEDLAAPEAQEDSASGWARLPDYDRLQPLPSGLIPLANHVTIPAALRRRIEQIGIAPSHGDGASLQASLQPGQRIVTLQGDLWRWDGLRTRADDAPSAAALRLRQINRQNELQRDLEDLRTRADDAIAAHDTITAQLHDATQADIQARTIRRDADRKLADAQRALSKAEADRSTAASQLETARLAATRHADDAAAAQHALDAAQADLNDLADLNDARAQADAVKVTVEAARITMMTRRAAHDELHREGEARQKRQDRIAKEMSGWTDRLQSAEARSKELQTRRDDAEQDLQEAAALPEEIAAARDDLAVQIAATQDRAAQAADALASAETALRHAAVIERDTVRRSGEAREARAGCDARVEASAAAVTACADRIEEDMGLTPHDLLSQLKLGPDDMPSVQALDSDVIRLRQQRDALGAVNLRAEDDAREIREEHDTLISEKSELEEAIRKLRSGIAGLNREGRERLLAAFEQVNENFRTLFTHLFGGGDANLMLVESDDPLDAGLEIMCQPPGKKLSTLSLLSGGEQTLTAMALIFAVFLANPAPICVLDEVDAPLDDANVTRFCDLLDEMTRRTETRFLIITHHAVTMARMDRLFGVTMQEQGVSQLVSVDLKAAEALVA